MRIALIADTHLSARSPECVANWHAARRAVGRLSPELTVHLGDITLDGQTHSEELAFAAQLIHDWSTPMLCVPGNHDVGDASGERPLEAPLLDAYVSLFGPDHWSVRQGGWLLLGVNAQLMGSATAQEEAQWRWLEDQVASADSSVRSALFLHRPVLRSMPGESSRGGRYITEDACDRLMTGPLRRSLRVVVSGHTHQYLDIMQDGVRHVWIPSSGFVLPDHMQSRVGEKVVGVGVLGLDESGVGFDLWCPDGMLRHDLSGMDVFEDMVSSDRKRHAGR